MPYRCFDHTADLGLEVTAATSEELYAGAVFALFDQLTDLTLVRAGRTLRIAVAGKDETDLLVNFLRECLYAWTGKGFLMKTCQVQQLTSQRLVAILRGEFFDPARHQIHQEIKAVTYHQALVRQSLEGWQASVILDI